MPITNISGPFCIFFEDDYIAEEAAGTPIIMETGLDNIVPEDYNPGSGGIICTPTEIFGDQCCIPEYVNFINESVTEIAYTASLASKHGVAPAVYVYYKDNDDVNGGLKLTNWGSRVSFVGFPITKIIANHGGPESGIIKIV